MKIFRYIFMLFIICTAFSACSQKPSVEINGHKFKVSLAIDDETRAKGLMYVNHLPKNEGMLFLFDEQEMQGFWMKNTYIDLDIIFISDDMTINCVYDMVKKSTPFTKESDVATAVCPAKYVLEIAGGRAKELNIQRGDSVIFNL
ncbi:DUF192 domain-containing protein [Parelusimicrobium proximum]|uniref:DUF192 domain-containing protein n=1 Tax=Parelusimicrobium proximum TaxID=3228953 RepID=UPI003D1672C7